MSDYNCPKCSETWETQANTLIPGHYPNSRWIRTSQDNNCPACDDNGFGWYNIDLGKGNTQLYANALNKAGYEIEGTIPVEIQLVECVKDYICSGVFRDMEVEDIVDYSLDQLAKGLIKYCK